MIDERGRLFGRINLVDGLVAGLILLLIPLGYATYLLFRPATPHIDSVTEAALTKAEDRLNITGSLEAKFKVRGGGFTPLMRARIGTVDALAFVFESPSSADVLVGPIPLGAHDLVLYDGIQEVARAKDAISIRPPASMSLSVRAAGWLTGISEATAAALKPGAPMGEGSPMYQIVALGPVVPGFRRLSVAGSSIYVPVSGTLARKAILTLECNDELVQNPCAYGNRPENRTPPVAINLPWNGGAINFAIEEVMPASSPSKATLRVIATGGSAGLARAGDRDDLLDERAAVVSSVNGNIVTLDAGIDRTPGGWQYRGQRLVPGAEFVFTTDRYQIAGTLQSIGVRQP